MSMLYSIREFGIKKKKEEEEKGSNNACSLSALLCF